MPADRDRQRDTNRSEGFGPLLAIVIAIVLGVVVGLGYGKQMWRSGSGPAAEIARLEATKLQKEQLASAIESEDSAEAARLRGHLPQIDERLKEVRREAEEHPGGRIGPLVVWELTKFCGDLFIQALKLLVIPLVITSMVCGIASLGDIRQVGRVGVWTVVYYLATGGVAVLIGILLVQVIRPGLGADDTFAYVTESVQEKEGTGAIETLLNVVRGRPDAPHSGMVPSNIFLAASETNVLALIVFALVFGAALTTLGEKGRLVLDVFDGANEAIMKMVHLVMWLAPLGIFGLVAYNIAKEGGGAAFGQQLAKLSWYVTTIAVGLLIHALMLNLVLWFLTGRNPLKYVLGVSRALLTALSTSSSSATLPVTIDCVASNNDVSKRSAGFVLPLGATVNMDGTALYEAVAVIFIAQSIGHPLSLASLIVIFLTATLAAIGAAGIPSAGLVTMVIVLTAVGLPISGIGLILAIDWFLDRLRTTINVYGDTVGAAVIDHYLEGPTP